MSAGRVTRFLELAIVLEFPPRYSGRNALIVSRPQDYINRLVFQEQVMSPCALEKIPELLWHE